LSAQKPVALHCTRFASGQLSRSILFDFSVHFFHLTSDGRRIVLLELTDKGRETITEIHETSLSYMKGILERMNSEDITALVKGMSAFIIAIELDQQEKIGKM
jgi:hypothetical protein